MGRYIGSRGGRCGSFRTRRPQRKMEDAIVWTVVIFVALILALRPAWGRRVFGEALAAIFVLHCVALGVAEYSLHQ